MDERKSGLTFACARGRSTYHCSFKQVLILAIKYRQVSHLGVPFSAELTLHSPEGRSTGHGAPPTHHDEPTAYVHGIRSKHAGSQSRTSPFFDGKAGSAKWRFAGCVEEEVGLIESGFALVKVLIELEAIEQQELKPCDREACE